MPQVCPLGQWHRIQEHPYGPGTETGIERMFSAPYHPQSNGKLEVFHKYLKPT